MAAADLDTSLIDGHIELLAYSAYLDMPQTLILSRGTEF